MKRMALLLLACLLISLCAAAISEGTAWRGETVMKEVNVRQSPDKNAKKVVTISKKGSPVEVLDSAEAADGVTWYQIVYHGQKKDYSGWVRGDLLNVGERPASAAGNTVEAASMSEAYRTILQTYREGIAAYEDFQQADSAFFAENYPDDFHGDAPLFVALIDLTGDGQTELLFICARDEDRGEPWYGECADLHVFAWRGDRAEEILFVENVYVYAGNGPWYEIYRPRGASDLYLQYSCNGPGTTEKYALNKNGVYVREKQAVCNFTDEDENGGYEYAVDGRPAAKTEYDQAAASLAVSDRDLIASTLEPTAYEIFSIRDALIQ